MAANVVPPGATVYVRGGTYAGFTMTRSGGAAGAITFSNFGNEAATIDGARSVADVVLLDGVHDVGITGFTIQGANAFLGAGIEIDHSQYVSATRNVIRANKDIGIHIYQSSGVTVAGNSISHNSLGIEVKYGGAGVRILNNTIFDNDSMVINDPAPGNDSGAVGVNFLKVTGPTLAQGNVLYGNRAPSDDYGYDGGAWEIYGASNVTITGNTSYNNEDVLETGTDGTPCNGNVFTRNTAWGASTAPVGNAVGLILRCAANMLIANNTFSELDYWIYDIETSGGFAGSIDGLTIENNIDTQTVHKIYAIPSGMPASVHIDRNLVWSFGGNGIASVAGRGTTSSLSVFTSWTGYDASGIGADPRYVDRTQRNYHLASSSPAIDAGLVIPGVTDGFLGAAPDLGASRHADELRGAPPSRRAARRLSPVELGGARRARVVDGLRAARHRQ